MALFLVVEGNVRVVNLISSANIRQTFKFQIGNVTLLVVVSHLLILICGAEGNVASLLYCSD